MSPSHQSQIFRNAIALYDNQRYYASHKLFKDALILEPKNEEISKYIYLSQEKLSQQLKPLLVEVGKITQSYPRDFEQQRKLWLTILSIDRDNEKATASLKLISEQVRQLGVQERCKELQITAQQSHEAQNLTLLNECYAEIQVLGQTNEFPELQPIVDEAVQDIANFRNQLRGQLGKPNTYIITNEFFDDYKLALVLLNAEYILDSAGLPADPLANYQRARNKFLVALDRRIEEELKSAERQEATNPQVALKTIAKCFDLIVEYTTIHSEDLDYLENFADLRKKKEQLESIIDRFQTADVLFKKAQSETLFKQFQLYIQVKNTFSSYPQIEDRIQEVVSQVDTLLLHRLKSEIQYVEDLLSQKNLKEAVSALKSLLDEKNEDNKLLSLLAESTEARRFYLEIPKKLHELWEIERTINLLNSILEKNNLGYSDYVQVLRYIIHLIKNYSICTILFQFDLDTIIDNYTRKLLDNTNPSQDVFLDAQQLLNEVRGNLTQDVDLNHDALCKPKADTVMACLKGNLTTIELILKYINDLNQIHACLYQKRTLTDEMYGNLAIILHGPTYGATNALKSQAQSILRGRKNRKLGEEYLAEYYLSLLTSPNSSSSEKREALQLIAFTDDRRFLSEQRKEAKVWGTISALTATAFLLMVLFMVVYSTLHQLAWSSMIIPLLSALPTFATMLVYVRANNSYEKARNTRKELFNDIDQHLKGQ